MKTSLDETFQKGKLEELYHRWHQAQEEYASPYSKNQQIISLTAPTGAGKTLIMTALIEAVYRGHTPYPAQENAIFLWLSDMPDLNEQSRLKIMRELTPSIPSYRFVTIEGETFDQRTLKDKYIYFINTQKLGEKKNLVDKRGGDHRQYTFWDTLRNTIEEKGERLFLIIDEAHRGTNNPKEYSQANSIMQKFLMGSPKDNMLPMPIVIGMSATSDRFKELVKNVKGATERSVDILPKDVRDSGLLKEHIEIDYVGDQQHKSEMSILKLAALEWKDKCEHWRQYHEQHGEKLIRPIMTIQVDNRWDNNTTTTDIDECLRVIEEVTGEKLNDGNVVNSFTEEKDFVANGIRVIYKEPQYINDDENVKIVFFKQNLSTGWDCPRAETMMSFRAAQDYTYISQLLGRMVRTPLHHRIETDDTLNEVRLFLPHFDKATADKVVDFLNSEGVVGATAREAGAKETQTLHVAEDLKEVYEWINSLNLLSDIIARNHIRNYVSSLFKLADLVKNETGNKNTKSDITKKTTRMIQDYIAELQEKGQYEEEVKKVVTFLMNGGRLAYLKDKQMEDSVVVSVNRLEYDIQKEFEVVDKNMAEEIAYPYLQTCENSDDLPEYQKHVIIFADNRMDELEKFAKRTFNTLKDTYRDELTNKNLQVRKKFHDIARETDGSDTTWKLYEPIYVTKGKVNKPKHLFVDDKGKAYFDLNDWEKLVLDEEIARPGFKCWIRNPKGRPESLCIRRKEGSIEIPFYPDFVIVTETNGKLSLSILEPHDPSRDDNLSKARALIEYGRKENRVKRLELIRVTDDNSIWRLDFKNSNVIEDMKMVDSSLKLNNLFKEYNG